MSADIVDFSIGCRLCANLRRLDKGTYKCSAVTYANGEEVYPRVDDNWTEDFGACNGESYVRDRQATVCKRRSV